MRILKAFTFKMAVSLGAAAAAALSMTGCIGSWAEPLERETRIMEIDHVAASPLKVHTENGDIDTKAASTSNSKAIITAQLKAHTKERLAATKVVATREADGTLSIQVAWPEGGRKSSEGCDFDIVLPDARNIDLESSNGEITASGFAGTAKLHTSNGAIKATGHAGSVDAHTSNGSVTLTDIQGDAVARSSNGSITVKNATGQVSADTSNGSINLSLPADFAGKLTLDTSNGSLNLQNENGVKVVKMKKNYAELEVGADQTKTSHAKTSNGNIDIKFAK